MKLCEEMQSLKNLELSTCMIISSFYPLIGGAERQAQRLAAGLADTGVDVCVLTRRYKGMGPYEEIDGVPVYRVLTLGRGALAALSYILSSLLWLLKYGKKYQVIHCHRAESPAIIGIFAKLLYGKKVVVKISGGDLGLVNQVIRRKLLSAVNVFIALTDEMRAKLIRCGFPEAKIVIIPNGVDTNRYMPLSRKAKLSMREKLGLPIDEKLIIFVGRLHPVKGLDTLLYAWQKISQSIGTNKARLLILGEGPQEPFPRQLVSQLGLEATILFLGRKGNVAKYLQSADTLALPSLSEGLPNALLEAMACGLPVVATDVGGNSEVISDLKNGILVKPKDSGQLAEALIKVLNDGGLAQHLGRQARKAVEERYSLKSVVDQYLGLYENLVSQAESEHQSRGPAGK